MNCEFKRKLPIPMEVKEQYPITDKMSQDFEERDIEDIYINGKKVL